MKDVKEPIIWTWAGEGRVFLAEDGYGGQCAKSEGGRGTKDSGAPVQCLPGCKPPAHLVWEVLLMPLFLGTSLGPLWAMEHRQAMGNLGLNLRPNSHTHVTSTGPDFLIIEQKVGLVDFQLLPFPTMKFIVLLKAHLRVIGFYFIC